MSIEPFQKPVPSQEQQDQADEKLETGKKVYKFLDKIKFLEFRESDEQFNNWFQKVSYEDFCNYLTRLNGILREVAIKKRSFDGTAVEISGIINGISYLPPSPKQKDELMKEMFVVLRKIPDNDDRALLLYYAIQAIHPYSDGNGRIGRLLYELLLAEENNLTEEKLAELLNHNESGQLGTGTGRKSFAEKVWKPERAYYLINRELAKNFLGKDFVDENGSIYVSSYSGVGSIPEIIKDELTPEESTLAKKILGEGDVSHFPFRGLVLAKLIREKPELQKYLYQIEGQLDSERGVVPEDIGKNFFAIDAEEIMSNLTKEDVLRIVEIHKEIKKMFIREMIDVFAHPEKHTLKDKDGDRFQIKDIFRATTDKK